MSEPPQELLLQITAGNGPVECAWAVMRTAKRLLKEAEQSGLRSRLIEIEPGPEKGTANSVLVSVSGSKGVALFANRWCGTVLWTGQSPWRPDHKRKNWFVGIEILEFVDGARFDSTELRWETMRASGPGGQHVNRTESAIRVTHVASGIQAVASEERSQHSNRKQALARLSKKLSDRKARQDDAVRAQRWRTQRQVERGNPVRTWRLEEADE
jgi:peptide chain release factor